MSALQAVQARLDDPRVINGVSGALSGAFTAAFVCPLDVIKTRLHVQQRAAVHDAGGVMGDVRRIIATEGLAGLYSGLSPTLLALVPNWLVYWTVYDSLKARIAARVAPPGRAPEGTPTVHALAAAGAGTVSIVLTNPLWVIKTRLQTQNIVSSSLALGSSAAAAATAPPRVSFMYKSTTDALIRITRDEGLRGLYSGLAPSLIGVLHVAIQFPLYEWLKKSVGQRRGQSSTDDLSKADLVATSAASKMVASLVMYPHEVVRSNMQIDGSGPLSGFATACRRIFRQDGLRGFYRGCATNLLRTTPAAAVTFTSYEIISKAMRDMAKRRAGQRANQ